MILISLNHKGPASELPSPEKWTQCRCICLKPSQAISGPVSQPFHLRELRAQHHAPCPPEKRRQHNSINKSTKTSQAPGLGEAHHLKLVAPCNTAIRFGIVFLHVFFLWKTAGLARSSKYLLWILQPIQAALPNQHIGNQSKV